MSVSQTAETEKQATVDRAGNCLKIIRSEGVLFGLPVNSVHFSGTLR